MKLFYTLKAQATHKWVEPVADLAFLSRSSIAITTKHSFSRKFALKRVCLNGGLFALLCLTSAIPVQDAQAQKLTRTGQAKVNALKARLNKAEAEAGRARAILNKYLVFQVVGKVQAGDTTSATIYGKAIALSGQSGSGTMYRDNFLTIIKPLESDYRSDIYDGHCAFVGVVRGTNTYIPLASLPDYAAAQNQAEKWGAIATSIQGEINATYSPYRKKASALAETKRQRDSTQAAAAASNQRRVQEAKERLLQAKQDVEQAKNDRLTKGQADAEVARLNAELEKTNAEKARLDAEAEKTRQAEAVRKANELQEADARKQAAVQLLKNTPSIIAGQQLGKIRLGMTEAEVLLAMGKPDVSLQLRKVVPRREDTHAGYYVSFKPRPIRRDRYSLKATEGLDIFYQGSPDELELFANERGIDPVSDGDLKTTFVFDVFYFGGRVVQLETDSPQFFTADGKNLQTGFDFEHPYRSTFIIDFRRTPRGSTISGESNTPQYGSGYVGSSAQGLSFCVQALHGYYEQQLNLTQPSPVSRAKVIVHRPNTLPFTGDYQLGISLTNKKNEYSDADNVEERRYDSVLSEQKILW